MKSSLDPAELTAITQLTRVSLVLLAQVKAGRVRAIASTNPKRGSPPFVELPALAETIPGFDLMSWQAAMVPRATPRNIIQRLNRDFLAVLDMSDVRQRMLDTGLEPAGSTPEAFDEFLSREYAKYGQVLKEAGIKPE